MENLYYSGLVTTENQEIIDISYAKIKSHFIVRKGATIVAFREWRKTSKYVSFGWRKEDGNLILDYLDHKILEYDSNNLPIKAEITFPIYLSKKEYRQDLLYYAEKGYDWAIKEYNQVCARN